jgi:hypothetical protein
LKSDFAVDCFRLGLGEEADGNWNSPGLEVCSGNVFAPSDGAWNKLLAAVGVVAMGWAADGRDCWGVENGGKGDWVVKGSVANPDAEADGLVLLFD